MKLNIGSGRIKKDGYVNIDCIQYIDKKGNKMVDLVLDIEKNPLPYDFSTVDEIEANNVLEHLSELRFVLNEFHRVLKISGFLIGVVPVAGSKKDFKDPTHKRHFIKDTFSYFCGASEAMDNRPLHPKYADYGFLPWDCIFLEQEDDLIFFKLKPRK